MDDDPIYEMQLEAVNNFLKNCDVKRLTFREMLKLYFIGQK
jgi:hypothetical protein